MFTVNNGTIPRTCICITELLGTGFVRTKEGGNFIRTGIIKTKSPRRSSCGGRLPCPHPRKEGKGIEREWAGLTQPVEPILPGWWFRVRDPGPANLLVGTLLPPRPLNTRPAGKPKPEALLCPVAALNIAGAGVLHIYFPTTPSRLAILSCSFHTNPAQQVIV